MRSKQLVQWILTRFSGETEIGLFTGNPESGGSELAYPGYRRQRLQPGSWDIDETKLTATLNREVLFAENSVLNTSYTTVVIFEGGSPMRILVGTEVDISPQPGVAARAVRFKAGSIKVLEVQ